MNQAEQSGVDIDFLIRKIREEAATKQTVSQYRPPADIDAANRIRSSNIEALLSAASAKSQVRTDLPAKLKQFPWNIGGIFGKTALKIYSFVFKEQRAVNFSLNQALRESLLLNQSFVKKLAELQAEVSDLQARIQTLETQKQKSDD
jgi:O-antigen chain-terminating methyltransferase